MSVSKISQFFSILKSNSELQRLVEGRISPYGSQKNIEFPCVYFIHESSNFSKELGTNDLHEINTKVRVFIYSKTYEEVLTISECVINIFRNVNINDFICRVEEDYDIRPNIDTNDTIFGHCIDFTL